MYIIPSLVNIRKKKAMCKVSGCQTGFIYTIASVQLPNTSKERDKWEKGLTIVADVPPACDGTSQAAWEERVRRRQADGTDVICPAHRAGKFYQRQVGPTVGFQVTWRNHHALHTMGCLVRVVAIHVLPTSIDAVRAHVVWTERGTEWWRAAAAGAFFISSIRSLVGLWKHTCIHSNYNKLQQS